MGITMAMASVWWRIVRGTITGGTRSQPSVLEDVRRPAGDGQDSVLRNDGAWERFI